MTVDSQNDGLTAFDTSDDLDAFNRELHGHEPAEKVVEEQEPVEEAPDDEPELDTDADEDAVETDEDNEPEPEEDKGKKKSAAARIKELTKERYDAERLAAVKIAELEGRLAELSKPKTEATPEFVPAGLPDGAPDPQAKDKDGNDIYTLGEFDPKYIQDLTRYTIKSEREAAEKFDNERKAQDTLANARAEAQAEWSTKLEATKEEIPDIIDKVKSLDAYVVGVPENLQQYYVDVIMTLENGPRVIAYLADNPEKAKEIVSSGPAAATVALGRIDARVAKLSAAPKTPTKAPTPPSRQTPRGTAGQFSTKADTDDLDAFTREFFKKK